MKTKNNATLQRLTTIQRKYYEACLAQMGENPEGSQGRQQEQQQTNNALMTRIAVALERIADALEQSDPEEPEEEEQT